MKSLSALFALFVAVMLVCIPLYAQDIKIIVDGSELECEPQPFIDESSRILVPFRAIFEELGASVDWNMKTKTVVCIKDDLTITLTVNSDKMLVNGKEVLIDSPARIVDGRIFVPLRAISECMGANVEWNFNEKTAYIDFNESVIGNKSINIAKVRTANNVIKTSDGIPILQTEVKYTVISGDSKGIEKINSEIKDSADYLIYWATDMYGEITDSAIERYNETGAYNTITADISVKYADKDYISYISSVKCNTGAVNPSETKQSGIFKLNNGKIVTLDEILPDKQAVLDEAEQKFYELIEKNPDIYYSDVKIDMAKTYYYLCEKGIVFGFNKQEIAPYSTGFVEVEVDF
jgi:hypothetical protein